MIQWVGLVGRYLCSFGMPLCTVILPQIWPQYFLKWRYLQIIHFFFECSIYIYIFSHYKPSRCLGSTILGNPHVSSRTLLLNVADFVILCWLMICITATDWNSHIWLVVWSFFYFSIYLEQSSHLTNIFQRGWHHKPVYIYICCCFSHWWFASQPLQLWPFISYKYL